MERGIHGEVCVLWPSASGEGAASGILKNSPRKLGPVIRQPRWRGHVVTLRKQANTSCCVYSTSTKEEKNIMNTNVSQRISAPRGLLNDSANSRNASASRT